MFSRASGARLREGNQVRLLKDAAQNYLAWLALVAGAVLARLALLAFTYPRGFAYPFAAVALWVAATLLFRGLTLLVERHRRSRIRL